MHNHALIQNIFSGGGGGGGMGIQLQTRSGPTNFTIAKTRVLENRGGGGVPKETRIVPAGVLS